MQEEIFDVVNLRKISSNVKQILRPSKKWNRVSSTYKNGRLHVVVAVPNKQMDFYVVPVNCGGNYGKNVL